MTTIIVIVVVALVFFVTVCVVTFMVWKREAEMRTDSIRAIESNLEKLGERLASESAEPLQKGGGGEYSQELIDMINRTHSGESELRRKRSRDPFSWMREDEGRKPAEPLVQQNDLLSEEIPKAVPKQCIMEEPVEEPEENAEIIEQSEVIADEKPIDMAIDQLQEECEENPQPEETAVTTEDLLEDLPEAEQDDEAWDDFQIELPDVDQLEESNSEALEKDKTDIPEFKDIFSQGDLEEKSHGHNIGRSGKKYTAEELEMLIKE